MPHIYFDMKVTRVFIFLMIFLSVLTVAKYRKIYYIKSNSKEFTFVIEGDEKKISNLKLNIQEITYQQVDEEKIEEGKYRLRIKCPPDRINYIWSLLSKIQGEKDG